MNSFFKHITRIVIGVITATSTNFLYASNGDSLRQHSSLSSEKILHLKTVWSESGNAASLHFFDIQQKIGAAYLNYNYENGDYHLFQNEKELNEIGFSTNGYVTLNKWKFYGDFNYLNNKSKGVNWTDMLKSYDDNPYILGDSVGGTYYKEYFKMRGKGAWQVNDRLTLGFDIKYDAGVGARRKDPRPKNTTTTFDISPALIIGFNRVKLGANFRYVGSKEDVVLTTVTDSIYSFFHFKGLGAFTSSVEQDKRSNGSNLFGGGFQFNYAGNSFKNLTEVNFYRKATDIKRGESYPLQVVLLEKYNVDVATTFMFSPSERTVNKLKLHFSDKHIYGHEPVVEPKLEQVSYQWATLAKYTLYWYDEQEFGIDYSYYKIINANQFNWGATITSKVVTSQSSYFFVPETNEQILNHFYIDGTFEKEFQSNLNSLILAINGGYRKGFNSSFEIVTDETLLETVNVGLVTHDFDYYNSQMAQLGGSFQFGRMIRLYKSPVQLFFIGDYKRLASQLNEGANRNIFKIKIGMNF